MKNKKFVKSLSKDMIGMQMHVCKVIKSLHYLVIFLTLDTHYNFSIFVREFHMNIAGELKLTKLIQTGVNSNLCPAPSFEYKPTKLLRSAPPIKKHSVLFEIKNTVYALLWHPDSANHPLSFRLYGVSTQSHTISLAGEYFTHRLSIAINNLKPKLVNRLSWFDTQTNSLVVGNVIKVMEPNPDEFFAEKVPMVKVDKVTLFRIPFC